MINLAPFLSNPFAQLPGSTVTNVVEKVDIVFLLLALLFILFGLVMITSASMDYSAHNYQDSLHYFRRHCIYIAIGLVAACFSFFVPLSMWEKMAPVLLGLSFLVLVLILVPGLGRTANNATRWLAVGPLTLQGSELAKIGVLVYLANYLVRQHEKVRSHWSGFFNPMLVLTLLVVLLLLEPDFGSVVVLSVAALGMLFLGGVRIWQFVILVAVSSAAVVVMIQSAEYRMQRLITFLDPWANPFSDGYQLTQSLIAFGRGEWFGLGLGNSIQKLFYLPEAHTDFIFAIIAEELGLVGCLILLGLYAFFIAKMIRIGRRAEALGQSFAAYIAYGITLIFSSQLFINVGVNIGLLPTKGLTLPFISYGGSSLLVSCILVALLLRIDCELSFSEEAKSRRILNV